MIKQYTHDDVNKFLHIIIQRMVADKWVPDYIVGLTRGGLVPAAMLSHFTNTPMHTLDVSFRDNSTGPESNLWMAEDAFGYKFDADEQNGASEVFARKNILIIDDINDSGRTLNWIKQDWPSGCLPEDAAWADIWHSNVRFATLINNKASAFTEVDYCGKTIDKEESPEWCVFPWENWWE